MRLRKKKWARPELESSNLFICDAKTLKGKWHEEFDNDNEIYLELGCGMGAFVAAASQKYSDKNFVAVDLKDEVLVYALRKVKQVESKNVRLTAMNIMGIGDVFEKGEVSRIYINFCNPWPKLRHKKRRLTHSKFLAFYKSFLVEGNQIWFKTDDDELFEESVEYFEKCGFKIKYITRDLHKSGFPNNIVTEYESKFLQKGVKIKFLIAELVDIDMHMKYKNMDKEKNTRYELNKKE